MLPHWVVWDDTNQWFGPAFAEQLGSFNVIEPIPCFWIRSVGNFMETSFRFSSHSFIIDFSMSSATTYILSKIGKLKYLSTSPADWNYLRAPRHGNRCKPRNLLRLECKMACSVRRDLKLLQLWKNIINSWYKKKKYTSFRSGWNQHFQEISLVDSHIRQRDPVILSYFFHQSFKGVIRDFRITNIQVLICGVREIFHLIFTLNQLFYYIPSYALL